MLTNIVSGATVYGQVTPNPPSLDLDFVNNETIDPRITFTRASTATYIDRDGLIKTAAANEMRRSLDPVTGRMGALIEEQRTNLLLYSEQFDNAAWGKARCTITSNAVSAPDGSTTADKIVDSVDNNTHYAYKAGSFSFTSGTTYTQSVFVKKGELGYFAIRFYNTNSVFTSANAIFNLTSGTLVSTDAAITGTSIVDCGNGWYRVSATQVAAATALGDIGLHVTNTSASLIYTGDGTSGLYIWGAQLEAGAFPTSYIPTTSAQVTRAADVASITGTNFSSWYNQSEGTFVCDFNVSATTLDPGARVIFGVADGTFNNSMYVVRSGYSAAVTDYIVFGGALQAALNLGNVSGIGSLQKVAIVHKPNDSGGSLNGTAIISDTSCSIPSVDRMVLGGAPWGGTASILNGHIFRLTYYPKRLSNEQLQALSAQ